MAKALWKIISKANPSASLDSEENRDLALLIRESKERLRRGLEELESLSQEISMQVEAARESYSQVREHLSILSEVASSRETNLVKLLQQHRSVIEKARAEDRSALAEAPLAAVAAEQQFEPVPWQQDQG